MQGAKMVIPESGANLVDNFCYKVQCTSVFCERTLISYLTALCL